MKDTLSTAEMEKILDDVFLEGLTSHIIEYNVIKEDEDFTQYKVIFDSFLGVIVLEAELLYNTKQKEFILKTTLPQSWDFSWYYTFLPKYNENKLPLFQSLKFLQPMDVVISSQTLSEEGAEDDVKAFLNPYDVNKIQKGLNYINKMQLSDLIFSQEIQSFFQLQSLSTNVLGDMNGLPPVIKNLFSPFSELIGFLPMENISAFFNTPLVSYTHVQEHKTYNEILFDIALPSSQNTQNSQACFCVGLESMQLYSSTNMVSSVDSGIKFLGHMGIKNSTQQVEVNYALGTSMVTINTLGEIPLIGFDFSDSSKLPIKTDFESIALKEVSLGINFENKGLECISLALGPNSDWQQKFLNSFIVDDCIFGFELNVNDSHKYRFYTLCNFLIGGGQVHVSAAYPELELVGELGVAQQINVDDIIEELLPISNFPKTEILDLYTRTNFKEHTFAFQLQLTSNWSFTVLGKSFDLLKNIFMSVERNQHNTLFALDATMVIADIEVLLLAVNVRDNNVNSEFSKWQFEGNSAKGSVIEIGELAKDFLSIFKLNSLLPTFLKELQLKDLGAQFNTENTNSTLFGTFQTKIFNQQTTLELKIKTTKKSEEEYTVKFCSELTIGNAVFGIVFINNGTKESLGNEEIIFTGSWKQKGDETLGINTIVEFLGLPKFPIPKGMDLGLTGANLVYTNSGNFRFQASSIHYGNVVFVSYGQSGVKSYFSGISIGHAINLSNLPLINQVFNEKNTLAIEDIQIVLSSGNIEEDAYEKINAVIDEGYPKIDGDTAEGYPKIDGDTAEGFALSLNLNIAGHKENLSVGTGSQNQTQEIQTSPNTYIQTTSITPEENKKHPNEEVAADGTLWYSLGQKLGPVTFEKIGLKYDDGKLWISLNSSLKASGLVLDLIQASIGTPLDEFSPAFSLKGIGVDYGNNAFNIDGTLLSVPYKDKQKSQYTGGAVFKTEAFALDAFGTYFEDKENSSLFIFLEVDRVFGGPPSFVLTGILGGFGYNSELRIPQLDEINDLPLIAGLSNPKAIGKQGDKATTPTQAMATLTAGDNPWVFPNIGNIWFAAGIKFSSFELMKSTALLVGEFGKSFSLAILGTSQGTYPKDKAPFVNFQLDLRAYFNPSLGELSFQSALSEGSYILDKNCHITGGFAMCFWFGNNAHSGDFVISMGGYSPYFNAPQYYPPLDRVGINWRVDSHVSIKGGSYFAVTPSAAMAGGNIELLFHAGNISAWVKGNFDVIIFWNPFYFITEVGVRVGAAIKMLGKNISVELGCKLGLWGPGFGGKVKVKILFIITFTIKFGASKATEIQKLSWDEFKQTLPDSQNYIKVVPMEGMSPKSSMENSDAQSINSNEDMNTMIIRPNGFCFRTESQIPNSELRYNEQTIQADEINIKPMDKKNLQSTQKIQILKKSDTSNSNTYEAFDTSHWTYTANMQNMATSLWGKGKGVKLVSGKEALIEQNIGFMVSAPTPVASSNALQKIKAQNIAYSTIELTQAYIPLLNPLDLTTTAKEERSVVQEDSIETISHISNNEQRTAVFNCLMGMGFELKNDSLEELSTNCDNYFLSAPMILQKVNDDRQ